MQKGRGWLRAIPRLSLYPHGYAGHMPYKLTPVGTFVYNGNLIVIPDNYRIQDPFIPIGPGFRWHGGWTNIAGSFDWEVLCFPVLTDHHDKWIVRLNIDGIAGFLSAEFWVFPDTLYLSGTGTYFFGSPYDNFAVTPLFEAPANLWLRAWLYSDGPP
jgi:hypothetical protein